MTELFMQIIAHTPLWVWVVLIILIKRGVALMRDNEVSLGRSLIMPAIFIIWGLDKIATKFNFPIQLAVVYIIFMMLGAIVSLFMYRHKIYYTENGSLIQGGSVFPITIMLTNFIVKYCLNVLLATQPMLYGNFIFNLIYGIISGFTVGLLFGGIIKTIKQKYQIRF